MARMRKPEKERKQIQTQMQLVAAEQVEAGREKGEGKVGAARHVLVHEVTVAVMALVQEVVVAVAGLVLVEEGEGEEYVEDTNVRRNDDAPVTDASCTRVAS